MKSFFVSVLAASLSLGAASVMAQDAASKPAMKPDTSMQDCKDHMNTVKGQKRSDPATASTDAKCASDSSMKAKGTMKSDGMKKHADSAHQMPASSATK